jgi:hypothetical protein
LLAELRGFWSEDIWDMRQSPVRTGLSPLARQRYLYFECKSQSINGELKYACWKKFSDGGWRTTSESTKVHLMIKWLNTLNPPPDSFMNRSFESWREKYRSYLKSRGMYSQGTTARMDGQQRRRVTPRDSAYISTLRQVFLQGTLVDVTGKTIPENGPLDTGDLQWFTRNVLAQALTNGYCAIPVVAGPCPHPNACLNCAHFRTDISFLEVHKAELRETERVIAKANANGWVRQIEMNERKRNNLFNIITSLEQTHA